MLLGSRSSLPGYAHALFGLLVCLHAHAGAGAGDQGGGGLDPVPAVSPVVIGPEVTGAVHLAPHTGYLENAGRYSIADVMAHPELFGPPPPMRPAWGPQPADAWLVFHLTNAYPEQRMVEVHFEVDWDTVEFHAPGPDVPPTPQVFHNSTRSGPMAAQLVLPPGGSRTCYLRVRTSNFYIDSPGKHFFVAPTLIQEASDLNSRFFQAFWVGCMLLTIIYLIGSFVAFRERSYLAIVYFILAITGYFLLLHRLLFGIISPAQFMPALGLFTAAAYITAAYMVEKITRVRLRWPRLRRWMWWSVLSCSAALFTVMTFSPNMFMVALVNALGLWPVTIIVAVLVRSFGQGGHDTRFAFIGLLAGALGVVVQLLTLLAVIPANVVTANAFQASIGVMLVLFVISESQRVIGLRQDQQRARVRALQVEMANQRTESDLRARIAETEMGALRAQMNPHFIFNALNSIGHYVQRNEADRAITFLTKFARLMRLVLENSRHAEVPLKDDLEALDAYLLLERARSSLAFDYRIEVDPAIDPELVLVPPMILQPFLENAIWHGMAGRTDKGLITLHIAKDNGQLRMTIEDDGQGRHAAATGEDVLVTKKTSLATTITRSRLELLQKQKGRPAGFRYVDLPRGTRVELLLPLEE